MNPVTVRYIDGLLEDLADPEESAAYLNAAIEDGDQQVFMMALRHVTEALGMTRVAREAGLNRESLYKMLSASGNPQLASLNALLRTLGLRIAVEVDRDLMHESVVADAVWAEPEPEYPEASPKDEATSL